MKSDAAQSPAKMATPSSVERRLRDTHLPADFLHLSPTLPPASGQRRPARPIAVSASLHSPSPLDRECPKNRAQRGIDILGVRDHPWKPTLPRSYTMKPHEISDCRRPWRQTCGFSSLIRPCGGKVEKVALFARNPGRKGKNVGERSFSLEGWLWRFSATYATLRPNFRRLPQMPLLQLRHKTDPADLCPLPSG